MIKNITAGKYIQVSGNNTTTYVNGYGGLQGVGNVRYNTSNQNMEVFDGNNWIMLNMAYPTIGLTPEAESLLDWASKKRSEELEIESLAKDNATIKDLINQIKEKQEQIKVVKTLLKSNGHDNEEQVAMQAP